MANIWKRRWREKESLGLESFTIISVPMCFVLILHSGLRGKKGGKEWREGHLQFQRRV